MMTSIYVCIYHCVWISTFGVVTYWVVTPYIDACIATAHIDIASCHTIYRCMYCYTIYWYCQLSHHISIHVLLHHILILPHHILIHVLINHILILPVATPYIDTFFDKPHIDIASCHTIYWCMYCYTKYWYCQLPHHILMHVLLHHILILPVATPYIDTCFTTPHIDIASCLSATPYIDQSYYCFPCVVLNEYFCSALNFLTPKRRFQGSKIDPKLNIDNHIIMQYWPMTQCTSPRGTMLSYPSD